VGKPVGAPEPMVVVEVLSPSTRSVDLTGKIVGSPVRTVLAEWPLRLLPRTRLIGAAPYLIAEVARQFRAQSTFHQRFLQLAENPASTQQVLGTAHPGQ